MSRLVVRLEVAPRGGTPIVTGEELILWLFLCIGCRPVPMRTLGSTVSLPFRTERITELLRWMFPFSFPVLVNVSTEFSLPGERSSSQMLLSAQMLLGGLYVASISIGTLTVWKLLLPSWLASFSQLWLRLRRGVQRRTGSRQVLGRPSSSTETVDTTSLRGSGSANPFSCGLPFWFGALPPLAMLGRQWQTLLETVWSLSALQARFLQSVAKQAAKATQADRRSWLRRQATSIQAGLDNGVSTSLWSVVRYLFKKKARKGPTPVVVLRTPQGGIASTSEDLAKV